MEHVVELFVVELVVFELVRLPVPLPGVDMQRARAVGWAGGRLAPHHPHHHRHQPCLSWVSSTVYAKFSVYVGPVLDVLTACALHPQLDWCEWVFRASLVAFP